MNCPKCGEELEDGKLYCEKCGEEILIVPEFEPEIENSIQESLNIMVDVFSDDEKKADESEDMSGNIHHHRNRIFFFGSFMVLLIVLLCIVAGARFYRETSFNYQISRANSFLESEDYLSACYYFERAIEVSPENMEVYFLLAETYLQAGNSESAISTFKEIVMYPEAEIEYVDASCDYIISIYLEQENYEEIQNFLIESNQERLLTKYNNYLANNVEFSYVEGTYAEIIPLKLTANTAGVIYYTIDGSMPDTNSLVYTSPIFLETGEYTIQAFFVNEFGLKSGIVSKTYRIDIVIPNAPEVSVYSGEYNSPMMIEAEVPEDCRVYYTSDGSEPTGNSVPYIGAIPMPLGRSRFKFITYNSEGVGGDVTTRSYELYITCEISVEKAQELVTEAMLQSGKIFDMQGFAADVLGRYFYRYQAVIRLNSYGDVYFVEEVYEDSDGIQSRTGAVYAVDIHSGDVFRLRQDERKQYILEEL